MIFLGIILYKFFAIYGEPQKRFPQECLGAGLKKCWGNHLEISIKHIFTRQKIEEQISCQHHKLYGLILIY